MSENGNGRVLNEHGDGVKLSKDGQRWKVWLSGKAAVYRREEVAYLRSTVITLAAHDAEEAENVGLLIHGLKSRFDAVLLTPEEVAEHDAVVEGCPMPDPRENRLGKFHSPDHDAPETQREAAVAVFPRSGTQRWRVLQALAQAGSFGATDEEISEKLGMGLNTVRPRRLELHEMGYVIDSGRRRPTALNHLAAVWLITESALAAGDLSAEPADES